MGFFDNIKEKKEAKELGLTVEQYATFKTAKAKGIGLKYFKQYLSYYSTKYNLDQFACYVRLRKDGYPDALCSRYIFELAKEIRERDLADFLAAEKLGISVFEYSAYAASLKNRMSVSEYAEFLKAQETGITIRAYLRYLRSFRDDMTLEEFAAYLDAEKKGMSRDLYVEYLRHYKNQFTIERYLDFDKVRSLGITIEDYNLSLEASKAGIPLDESNLHKQAENPGRDTAESSSFVNCSELAWPVFEAIPKEVETNSVTGNTALNAVDINDRNAALSNLADKHETQPPADTITTEEAASDQKPRDTISDEHDNLIHTLHATNRINICGQLHMEIPSTYLYSTDRSVIGENRILIAVLDDGISKLTDPYLATESITILDGGIIDSLDAAEVIATSIGLKHANTISNNDELYIKYAVSEASDTLTIIIALICTCSHSYPLQFFFNGKAKPDAEFFVHDILSSIRRSHF